MKHLSKLILIPLNVLFLASFTTPNQAVKAFDGKAYDNKARMDFTDSTEEEVKTYYHYDTVTKESGKTRRKSLYDIISKNNTFVSYSSGGKDVGAWYKITDRNWQLSQTIDPATYKFADDDKLVNGQPVYYETLLYFDDTTTKSKRINGNVNKKFEEDTTLTNVDWVNKKKPSNRIQRDKEHVWVKSHGFSPKGNPCPGAGTDLHHLISADHTTNNLHNDLRYGEVADKAHAQKVYCLYADNTQAVSGWIGKTVQGEKCFEPTGKWKGDIARALLYRGVRYSDYKETNTEAEPYLELTDDVTKEDDNAHYHGVFHNLSTYLKWNEQDPVDEYEKHRNNLIYKNVQNNRNPFVDYPSWARAVYDPAYVPEVPDNPEKPSEKPSTETKPATVGPNSNEPASDSSKKNTILTKLFSTNTIWIIAALSVALVIGAILIVTLYQKNHGKKKKNNSKTPKKKPANKANNKKKKK